MAVSEQDVRHVAMLARLGLTDARTRELTHDLNTILEHMDVLSRVDTTGIDEAAAPLETGGQRGRGMRLYEDRPPGMPLVEPPEAFAPAMRDGFLVVPRLASHEDPEVEESEPMA